MCLGGRGRALPTKVSGRVVLAVISSAPLIAHASNPQPAGPPTPFDLSGDIHHIESEASSDPGGAAALDGAEPRAIYLFWADGTTPPRAEGCSGAPPAFKCNYGGDEGALGCKKKVQAILDRWYADFNVVFTLERPAVSDYYLVIVASDGAWCKQPSNVAGFASLTCGREHRGGAAYIFRCGDIGDLECAVTIAQENAHNVGLQHTFSKRDVMYPEKGADYVGFEDKDNQSVGPCGSRQNSYRLMLERLGPWPGGPKPGPFACQDADPPRVRILEPADGAVVGREIRVRASVDDDCGVARARIVAGASVSAAEGSGPFIWDLGGLEGKVEIVVTAEDGAGKTGSAKISVTAPGPGRLDGGDRTPDADGPASSEGGGGCGCVLGGPGTRRGPPWIASLLLLLAARSLRRRRVAVHRSSDRPSNRGASRRGLVLHLAMGSEVAVCSRPPSLEQETHDDLG